MQSIADMLHCCNDARHLHRHIIHVEADGDAPGLPSWNSRMRDVLDATRDVTEGDGRHRCGDDTEQNCAEVLEPDPARHPCRYRLCLLGGGLAGGGLCRGV
jgi:hypothetical protein